MILGLLKSENPLVIELNNLSFCSPNTYVATLDDQPVVCMTCVEEDDDLALAVLEAMAYRVATDEHQG